VELRVVAAKARQWGGAADSYGKHVILFGASSNIASAGHKSQKRGTDHTSQLTEGVVFLRLTLTLSG
jgi:hypothetical protein